MKRFVIGAVALLSLVAGAAVAATNYGDISRFTHVQFVNGSTFSAADPNPTKAQLQASDFFCVNTASNAVDLDFANDAALDTNDIGSAWTFMVCTGHATQALTVTAGASGVTTVTTINTSGTTCEDEGDYIRCIARTTAKITCSTFCAD
jgi:hypothetical protein